MKHTPNFLLLLLCIVSVARLQAQPGIGISYRVSNPSVPRPTITSPGVALSTVNAVSTVQRLGGTFTYGGTWLDVLDVDSF